MTVEDYQAGRVWDDAVCYSFYPIDLHKSTGGTEWSRSPRSRANIAAALLPAGSNNFLVAGRCIASDRRPTLLCACWQPVWRLVRLPAQLAALSASTGSTQKISSYQKCMPSFVVTVQLYREMFRSSLNKRSSADKRISQTDSSLAFVELRS